MDLGEKFAHFKSAWDTIYNQLPMDEMSKIYVKPVEELYQDYLQKINNQNLDIYKVDFDTFQSFYEASRYFGDGSLRIYASIDLKIDK